LLVAVMLVTVMLVTVMLVAVMLVLERCDDGRQAASGHH